MALLFLCCVAVVSLLPATLPAPHGADSWLMFDAAQQSAPRRITPKSIFIAPSFSDAGLPSCAEGYRPDSMGRCVKVVRVNQAAQLDFLLRRLNTLYAPPPPLPPPAPPTGGSGPLQVSLPIAEAKDDPAPAAQASGSSLEVAVVLADVVKGGAGADVPQTMLAVWNNISKHGSNGSLTAASENIDAGDSGRRNTTGFLSSLSLPQAEETIPIVMQTPPSTLVIQDLPGPDTVSRPLSSEVDLDLDIPYYDYYQDRESADTRCPDPPCKDSFTEIDSRSPHVPDTSFVTSSESRIDNVTESSVFPSDVGENDTRVDVSSAEATSGSDVTDAVAERESEVFPNGSVSLPVDAETVASATNAPVSPSSANVSDAAVPDVYAGGSETSVDVGVRPMTGHGGEAEEIVGDDNSTDSPAAEANATDSRREASPKRPATLPEESSLVGTSMDPLSDVDESRGEDVAEQRSPPPDDRRPSSAAPVRFPSAAAPAAAGGGRVRFPDAAESRVVFPRDPSSFWWLPAGWRLDQSRHHPVLLRFWKKMPEAYLPQPRVGGRRYPALADG